MFELIKMELYRKESSIKAFFDFVYDGLVVKGATLFLDEKNELQIGMPYTEDKNKNKRTVCYFKTAPEENMEPLKYLVLQRYNQLIAEKN